jgi:hypothetical protein
LASAGLFALSSVSALAYESYAVDQGMVDQKSKDQTGEWEGSAVNLPAYTGQANTANGSSSFAEGSNAAIEACVTGVGISNAAVGSTVVSGLFGSGTGGIAGLASGLGALTPATSFGAGGAASGGSLVGGAGGLGGGFGGSFGSGLGF